MSKLTDIGHEVLNQIQVKNLYKPENVYDIDKKELNDTISKITQSIVGGSYDFSNSILGRVLLPNTPIQRIANQELAKAFAQRVTTQLKSNLLPTINVNNILKGGKVFNEPDYWVITKKDKSTFSEVVEILTGYQSVENPFLGDTSNDALKENRGKGTKEAYEDNLVRNTFQPEDGYANTKNEGENGLFTILDGVNKSSILSKTKEIIDKSKLKDFLPILENPTMDNVIANNMNPDAVAFTKVENGIILQDDLLPKGANVRDGVDGEDGKFFRSWTRNNKYDTYDDLIRYENPHFNERPQSVLRTVFPNIAPNAENNGKNLMFSIENLAFVGNSTNLKEYEVGSNGGRVMWFPPYDLTINESIRSEWETVKFIGRNEPLYTYNGAERSITLGFKLIVDYPEIVDSFDGKENPYFDKFFRKYSPIARGEGLSKDEKTSLEVIQKEVFDKKVPEVRLNTVKSNYEKETPLKYYFNNDVYNLDTIVRDDNPIKEGQQGVDEFNNKINTFIEYLNGEEGQNFKIVIKGYASTLNKNKPRYNEFLSFLRAREVYKRIHNGLKPELKDKYKLEDYSYSLQESMKVKPTIKSTQKGNDKFSILYYGDTEAVYGDASAQTINRDVVDRKTEIWLEYSPMLGKLPSIGVKEIPNIDAERMRDTIMGKLGSNGPINGSGKGGEAKYLEALNEKHPFIYENYKDRIRHFSPVYHSQTPQDFNMRLTFLQQCARQGGAENFDNKKALVANSIFGKPPVCILRLGDFYHTKMVINSIQLSYEPLIWDMNPEGIGMQPMLCDVTMECHLIGGQSFEGPLAKLQNALDYNYYANTQVYEKKARRHIKDE